MSWGPLGPPVALRLAWLVVRGDRELLYAVFTRTAFRREFPDDEADWDGVRRIAETLRKPVENPFRLHFYRKLAEDGMGLSAFGHVVPESRALWPGKELLRYIEASHALEEGDRSRWYRTTRSSRG